MLTHMVHQHSIAQVWFFEVERRSRDIYQKIGSAFDLVMDWIGWIETLGPKLFIVPGILTRSEEHTSELQSQSNLVCRLLLEKKKKKKKKQKKIINDIDTETLLVKYG